MPIQALRQGPFGPGVNWEGDIAAVLIALAIGYVGLRLLGWWPRRRGKTAEPVPDAEGLEDRNDPDGQHPEGGGETAPGSRLLLVFTVLVVIALGALLIAGLFLGR